MVDENELSIFIYDFIVAHYKLHKRVLDSDFSNFINEKSEDLAYNLLDEIKCFDFEEEYKQFKEDISE